MLNMLISKFIIGNGLKDTEFNQIRRILFDRITITKGSYPMEFQGYSHGHKYDFVKKMLLILFLVLYNAIWNRSTWRFMMTSSNGNIFRVTGPLCEEFTGPRWIPHAKASDPELWCFLSISRTNWMGILRRFRPNFNEIMTTNLSECLFKSTPLLDKLHSSHGYKTSCIAVNME